MTLNTQSCGGAVRLPSLALALLGGLTAAVVVLFLVASTRGAGAVPLPVLGTVEAFRLTNQLGRPFDTASLRGRPWVADLIFTRCPGPCVRMTRNLAALQARAEGRGLALITLTADPEHDQAPVLEAYGRKLGADFRSWQFLTGARAEINRVAMRQLLLAVEEKEPAQRESEDDLYLHSTKWVLVDGAGRLRAAYEGTEPESIRAVLRDLKSLEREGSR